MFKLTLSGGIIRLSDGANLPATWENGALIELDPASPFIDELRNWLAAGNVPAAADPLPPQIDFSDSANLDHALKAIILVAGRWNGKTAAQIKADFRQAWIDTA